jgi:hypothetical protein
MSAQPEALDRDYLRRLSADGLLWHSEGMPEHTLCVSLPKALDQVDLLLAACIEARSVLHDLMATRAPNAYPETLGKLEAAIAAVQGESS